MKVNELSVGPIVGWTQFNATRIWGRGGESKDEDKPFCFGVARIRKADSDDWASLKLFKMLPHFDFTGICDFQGLKDDEKYVIEVGYFHSETDKPSKSLTDSLDWSNASTAQVITPEDDAEHDLSFVFGSCRYVLRFLGVHFDKRGDKTFRSILRQIDDDKRRTDLLFMVGDQIYADDLNILGPDDSLKEYYKRYRTVFKQKHIRKLMAQIPTYMILDDHEIRNNWSQDDFFTDWGQRLLPVAMHAYQSYQLVHGPAFKPVKDKEVEDTPERIWFNFEVRGASFFAIDTRTERFNNAKPPELISFDQMNELKAWLADPKRKEQAKFIVTSVPFFPDQSSPNDDKWEGFREQRSEILEHIRRHKIRKAVFLSGDVHASMACQLVCSSDPDFRVSSVVSSSIYYPYSHGSSSTFRMHGALEHVGTTSYLIENSSPVISSNNFSRVTLSPAGLDIEVFGRKGAKLLQHKLPF